jgi:hypothetical protein
VIAVADGAMTNLLCPGGTKMGKGNADGFIGLFVIKVNGVTVNKNMYYGEKEK